MFSGQPGNLFSIFTNVAVTYSLTREYYFITLCYIPVWPTIFGISFLFQEFSSFFHILLV